MEAPLVRYQLAVSLDGLIGPEDGSVDWLGPYESLAAEVMTPFMAEIGGLLMGRVTYEKIVELGGWPFWHLPTTVLTSAEDLVAHGGAHICTDGPESGIRGLTSRMESGDIWMVGGGKTASWLLGHGLLDRIEITTIPVILGKGIPLFSELKNPASFDLITSRTGSMGTVSSTYGRRG